MGSRGRHGSAILPRPPDALPNRLQIGGRDGRGSDTVGGVASPEQIVVQDGARRCGFGFDAMLDYHGGGSPAGVAHAFKIMERAFPLLSEDSPPERRQLSLRTAFAGPGARDAFELVTRAVTGDRYQLDASLGRPERGATMERFVFVVAYRDRELTLSVRDGFVPDELIELARVPDRDTEQEARFAVVKAEAAELVMAHSAAEVYDAALAA